MPSHSSGQVNPFLPAPSGRAWVILPAPCGKAWKIHCQSCSSNFKENCMPPILGKSCLFLGKARPSRKRMGGIPFSLKLEGQDWQCIFHAFPQGAGRITHALPLGPGRHGFSFLLDAGRHDFSCTSPCFQFIMED